MAVEPSTAVRETAGKRGEAAPVVRSSKKALRVSFFGHFGSTNHGNESTLLAILWRLRSLYPGAEFRCICTNPDAVTARDGIEAVLITRRDPSIWDRRVTLARRLPMVFVGVGAQLSEYARAFRKLKGTSVLIVPGTGLVTDAFGVHDWGLLSQFKWVLMAKLRGAQVMYVSVGAGPLDRPVGRALAKATLSLANYRSFRDDASRDYMRGIGFPAERDPVYPDLVFDLPEAILADNFGPSRGPRPVVGLGLMVYSGQYSAVDPRPETYTAYLEALAGFAAWLLDRGYDIRLLLGDGDSIAIKEFSSVLRSRLGSYDEERIIGRPIKSVHDLLAGLAASDFVVGTRFHNVLMAMLLNKPVIAISFHHKCSSLMHEMNLSDYCHDIHQIDADRLIAQFRGLEKEREAVKRTISLGVDRARAALDEQYDLMFGPPKRARRGAK